jgi:hypothetical protein
MDKRMFDVFSIKKQKLIVSNSSSTTTLESENEDLNIGLDIDIIDIFFSLLELRSHPLLKVHSKIAFQ